MRFLIRAGRGSVVLAVGVACAAFAAPATADIAPAGTVTAAPAVSRPGNAPAVHAPAPPSNVVINRPTMSMKAYRQAKAAASRAPYVAKPGASRSGQSRAATAHGFAGVNKAGSDGWFPSDVNGAVGAGRNVLTTNDRYIVYKKSTTKTILKNVSLNTLFGYAAESMFDPRVVFDPAWQRFVVSSDAFEESGTSQVLALAFSQTKNPAGGTWNYLLNGKSICGNDVFVDYPQISTTQDAVIVTVSCFRNSDGAFLGSAAIGLAKAVVYNGGGFSVPVFRYFSGTSTPPNVLDGNPRAHILLAGGGTAVRDLSFSNPASGFYATMAAPVNISGFQTPTFPPNARQPGCSTTSCQIDTSDERFVSPSTQVGDSLWNVATYGLAGGSTFAAPYWGEFDVEGAGADTTKQFGVRFLNGTSDDYNASLVSGADGRMFMTWSSSGPSTFISEVVAARKSTDGAGSLPTLLVPFTSSSTLTGDFDSNFGSQRWGDTSQITRDTNATTAWAWNGTSDGGSWGTFTSRFVNP